MNTIPMLDLKLEYEYMKEEIDSAVKRCLDHQRWIFGPELGELEEKIADYLGTRFCIGVSSGTEALVLSLRALAIKRTGEEFFGNGDEIITTPFTFTATGDAILRSGATPVFVDIDPETYNVSPDKIREAITEKTVGILSVHLYGQSCEMDEISKIADEEGLFVLEDVAQAFGATWKGSKLGTLGSSGAFSFFPSKNLGGFGDGGMVSTDDPEIAELVRMLVKHGGKDKYNVDHVGYNARLDTIQAAVLLVKLKYIDEFNGRRTLIAQSYSEGLGDLDCLSVPSVTEGARHVFHQYTIRSSERERLQAHLKESGVSSMIYYPLPLHKMGVFQGRSIARDLADAETAAGEVLSFPVEPLQSEDDTQRVIEAVRGVLF